MLNNRQCHSVSAASKSLGATVVLLITGGVTALTLGVAFGLLALGVDSFWVAFPVGFGVILPGAIGIAQGRRSDKRDGTDTRPEQPQTALEVLKRRYAAGELSDEEFEHRVERLLESEVDGSSRGVGTDIERR